MDPFRQIANAAKGTAADSLARDLGEPALDLIEPL